MSATEYTTIRRSGESLYKEKGSKFFGYAYHVMDEEQAKEKLIQLQDLHPKARHICYAYRLGYMAEVERSSDDGEPSGTAGKPILGQLVKNDLTFAIAVVVRYFGGTLLGTGGLIKAYREAAALALEECSFITKAIEDEVTLSGNYDIYNSIESAIADLNFIVTERDLSDHFIIKFLIPHSETEEKLIALVSKVTEKYPEEIDLNSNDFGFTIKVKSPFGN